MVPSSSAASSSDVPIKSYDRHASTSLSERSRIDELFPASGVCTCWIVNSACCMMSKRHASRKWPATLRCCVSERMFDDWFIATTSCSSSWWWR
eukprot:5868152-Prymnesium_polylepis.1